MTKTVYQQHGQHAVILLHAYTSTPDDFTGLARELTKQGYTIYAPTLSGHGTDDPADIFKYDIEDWLEDGREALNFIRSEGYKHISIFGLSLGGIVTTALAMENDDLASFGTFSSPVMINDHDDISGQFKQWFKAGKVELGYSQQEAEQEAAQAMDKLKQVMQHLNEFKEDLIPAYKNYVGNVFVGQGAQDQLIDPKHARQFVDELKQATVTFKWYEDGGHVITIGSVGRKLRDDVKEFLNNLG